MPTLRRRPVRHLQPDADLAQESGICSQKPAGPSEEPLDDLNDRKHHHRQTSQSGNDPPEHDDAEDKSQ